MNMKRSLTIFLSLLAAACAPADVRRADTPSARSLETVKNHPTGIRDTTDAPLRVDRPVLVAFFAVTQAQVDSRDDTGEALSDFQYYLPAIKLGLDSLGVELHAQYTDTVRYVVNGRAQLWVPAKDSADVGYLLLRPGAEPKVQYAVSTNSDLLDQVREWLGSRKP
jgi:hypothetical protein